MPYFVMVDQRVEPSRLELVLATIRADFATSRSQHPGRRAARIFQRRTDPNHILAIGEWDSQGAYESLRQSRSYQEASADADPPATIQYLQRLRFFARMSTRPAVVTCATMTAPEDHAESLIAHVLGDGGRAVEQADGLISQELYQVGEIPGRILVVLGWRSQEHLERFRAGAGSRNETLLDGLGVSIERFTGVIAAQFSRYDVRPGLAGGSGTASVITTR